jgi:hypothetical protein
MVSKSTMALSFGIVLGAASVAIAATKHPVHHRAAVETSNAYGAVSPSYASEPAYMAIQSEDLRRQN